MIPMFFAYADSNSFHAVLMAFYAISIDLYFLFDIICTEAVNKVPVYTVDY